MLLHPTGMMFSGNRLIWVSSPAIRVHQVGNLRVCSGLQFTAVTRGFLVYLQGRSRIALCSIQATGSACILKDSRKLPGAVGADRWILIGASGDL